MAIKSPMDRLRDVTTRVMDGNKLRMARYVREMTRPGRDAAGNPTPPKWALMAWKERSIQDVAALQVTGMHEAAQRADKMASRPAGQLAVVVIPARMDDPKAWEAKAAALDASTRKVIDTTAGPAVLKEPAKP